MFDRYDSPELNCAPSKTDVIIEFLTALNLTGNMGVYTGNEWSIFIAWYELSYRIRREQSFKEYVSANYGEGIGGKRCLFVT
ncbi:hypothetical protein K3495_g8166 [Podosphaera aphanis]|nr:hypothetical protein K3495_g8166 [Podosphaera aphanis]